MTLTIIFYVLPGSHKTRDKKCSFRVLSSLRLLRFHKLTSIRLVFSGGIAAPLLEQVLTSTLTLHDITVDTTGASLHHLPHAEEISISSEEEIQKVLHSVSGSGDGGSGESKEVGLFRISHLSGHKYSGVMIVSLLSLRRVSRSSKRI